MLILNPEFLKQVKIATNQYISNYGSKKEGKNKLDSLSLKIPTYYFYQYESNYQLIGFLNFTVTNLSEIREISQSKSTLSECIGESVHPEMMMHLMNQMTAKLTFKHYPLKFLQLNEIVTEHKSDLPKFIEK